MTACTARAGRGSKLRPRSLMARLVYQVLLLAALALLFGPDSPAQAGGPYYGEPITLPGVTVAADPHVIRVGATYYMYPTANDTAVEAWSSTDMVNWEHVGIVWGPAIPGNWNDHGLWAPDVQAFEGKYYMYYTANQKIGVAVADQPEGPFIDVYDHPLIGAGYGGTEETSIDANVFRDDDGSFYMYCTDYIWWISVIRVSPMSDPVTVNADWRLLIVPGLSWETFYAEGPYMVKHDGVYYLMYSGSSTSTPFYAVGYATADNPLGPFHKYEDNPILRVDWFYDFWGPGHNSVVTDQAGDRWIFYHTKTDLELDWNRVPRKNQLDFDAQGNMYVVLYDDDTVDDDTVDDDTVDDDTVDDDAVDDDTIDDDTADDDIADDDSVDDDAIDDDLDDDAIDDDETDDDSAGQLDDDSETDDNACGC